MLTTPSWSVSPLLKPETSSPSQRDSVSREQLYHLLRLSALPLPESEAEEKELLNDLESQLHFVRAIQRVDTEEVQPLVAIRDETEGVQREEEISLETLKKEFEKEEVWGSRGRIRRKSDVKVGDDAENWNPLACAPKTKGRFIALETEKH